MTTIEPGMGDLAWVFPDWPAPRGIRAAVTTRHGPGVSAPPFERFNLGLSSGDNIDAVVANRCALREALGLPSTPRWLQQVHGTVVADLGPLSGEHEPQADAAVSRVPGTVLAILTADCVPVLFASDDGHQIGAAHAGWKGLAAGVLEATVEQMQVSPQRVTAWIGPCIGTASYEIDAPVRDAFVHVDASATDYFQATRPGHWLCDMAGLARHRLVRMGVPQIFGGDFDTRTDERFYSYRREGARSGRFASLVWLEG
ncbi:peptidoglycan editing factor PgeF [Dyella sp.]|uniref:peptidoglycan editing factor PgeF n=1 Tax=Dyella sp. TaxID=1869338 RepID=UPI002ED34C5D